MVNRGNQVEAQGKSLSAITIPLTQDTKHFQLAKYMFNHDPFSSQGTISLFFSFRQSMGFGFLERCLTVVVKVCQALITCIRQDVKMFGKITSVVLEQLKVVFTAITKSRGSNYLRFLGVTLLFAAVMLFLTFLDAQLAVR